MLYCTTSKKFSQEKSPDKLMPGPQNQFSVVCFLRFLNICLTKNTVVSTTPTAKLIRLDSTTLETAVQSIISCS